jgi:dihydropteroate synthase
MMNELWINEHKFEWGKRTYVMGVINITEDSFSGDGLIRNDPSLDFVDSALSQAKRFVDDGVDILDVGAESTRPGAQPVAIEDEMKRILPVVEALVRETNLPISVDTYKASVAEAALNAGAHMVNDVWGFKADPDIARVSAHNKVPVILMHNRSSWAHAEILESLGGRYVGMEYDDLLSDIKRELMESVEIARKAGIPNEHIILDPGIGFGKTVEQNLELIDRLVEIRELGFPILLGASRKSFIGYTLDLPPDQRVEGTAAAIAVGITRGADIVRIHDSKEMVRVVKMTDAIVRHSH